MAASRDPSSLNERAGPEIVVRRQGTTTAIEVRGEWDVAGSPSIRHAICRAMDDLPECIVLDLSQVEFMDSTGLHAAIELTKRSAAQNKRLVIIPGPGPVQRMFEITGLLEQLPFIEQGPSGSSVARPHSAQNGPSGSRSSSPPTSGAGRPPQAAGVAPSSAPPGRESGRTMHRLTDPRGGWTPGAHHDKLHCPRARRASRITTRRPVTSH